MTSITRWRFRALALSAILIAIASHEPASQAQGALGTQSLQPAAASIEGTFTVVWGDPAPRSRAAGATRYELALANGKRMQLQLKGQENAALQHFGKHVTVSGLVVPSAPNTDSLYAGTIIVDTITATPPATEAVTGTKKVIYLLVKFSDDASVPHAPVFYTDLNNPDTPPVGEVFPATVNGFFKKTSWNQFSWIGVVGGVGGIGASGGWLTLPHTKSYYAPCGWSDVCAQLGTLGDDATALGRAQGINFTAYDNINFVLSNDLDCCAWGGGYFSSVDGRAYGATWEPPWGQETGVYCHEMGHSLGLPHSGWVYYAYDSPWDVMSSTVAAASVLCGSYPSANDGGAVGSLFCSEPGDGYITAHKDYLGWIPAANAVVSDTSTNTTVTLEGGSLPLGAAVKILKICIAGLPCTGPTAHYFTVEARVKGLGGTSQFDNGIPGEGIIIHDVQLDRAPIAGSCFFNNASGWAVPIDSTPGDYDSLLCSFGSRIYPNFALYNAQWSAGQTYTNGFSINVISRTGSTFVVSTTGKAPPTVAGIVPGSGSPSGGTNVTITGTDFVAGSAVSLGGAAATNVVVVSPTTITATTPAHTPGTVNVSVTNPLGQSDTIASAFLYTTGPIISAHPLSQSVPTGGSAALFVTASGTALTYQWYTGTSPDLSSPIGGATSSSYNTPALTSPKSYWVRVANGSGIANSNTATISVTFTDSTLTPGSTAVKRAHIAELRTRIDALRLRYGGLAPYTYTADPAITAGVTTCKAQHIVELRAALAPAYLNVKGVAATYATDPVLVPGTKIKAAHISELRTLVLSIE